MVDVHEMVAAVSRAQAVTDCAAGYYNHAALEICAALLPANAAHAWMRDPRSPVWTNCSAGVRGSAQLHIYADPF